MLQKLSDKNNAESSVDVNNVVISKVDTDSGILKLTFEDDTLTIPDDDTEGQDNSIV